eukprot:c19560_g2_i2.p1 GENE.c19560_g2_i2~~c19560_g2_i2.p1  ORF type:complete len:447 (-),score=61.89 c19560_g2_i2:118-1458(-)
MFFGQLVLQEYVDDPALSFAAIGDFKAGDKAPLQITEFQKGHAIDSEVQKLWLEGGGGGNNKESYLEAMMYFASPACVRFPLSSDKKSFFFITGDEGMYPSVERGTVRKLFGNVDLGFKCSTNVAFEIPAEAGGIRDFHVTLPDGQEGDVHVDEANWPNIPDGTNVRAVLESSQGYFSREIIIEALKARYHVFHLRKPNDSEKLEAKMKAEWETLLGRGHVLPLFDPRACVDVILGAISIVSGSRTLDEYILNLEERHQSEHRRRFVRATLAGVRAGGQRVGRTPKPLGCTIACTRVVPLGSWLTSIPPDVRRMCEQFALNAEPGDRLELPTSLERGQRKLVHIWAYDRGIVSATHDKYVGIETKRCTAISKPKLQTPAPSSDFTDDGHTYDRASIETWLTEHHTSPLTFLTKLINASRAVLVWFLSSLVIATVLFAVLSMVVSGV